MSLTVKALPVFTSLALFTTVALAGGHSPSNAAMCSAPYATICVEGSTVPLTTVSGAATDARNAAFKDLEAAFGPGGSAKAFQNFLKSRGFTLRSDINAASVTFSNIDGLKQNLSSYFTEFQSAQCHEISRQIINDENETDPGVLATIYDYRSRQVAKIMALEARLYSQSLESFYDTFKTTCANKKSAGVFTRSQPKACTQEGLLALRSQIINAFRSQDPNAGSVVVKNNLSVLRWIDTWTDDQPVDPPALPIGPQIYSTNLLDVNQMRARLKRLAGDFANETICDEIDATGATLLTSATNDFINDLYSSKIYQDSLIERLYPSNLRPALISTFEDVRARVGRFIEQTYGGVPGLENKVSRIKQSLSGVSLFLPAKLRPEYYERVAGFPFLVLNRSKIATPIEIDTVEALSDSSLNAYYHTSMSSGVSTIPERVAMLPGIIALAKNNIHDGLFAAMAHELGHRLDFTNSVQNGFDLRDVHRKLVSCLSSSQSIHMHPGQENESIADWVSSNVTAQYLSEIPTASQRRQTFITTMQPFCTLGTFPDIYEISGLTADHPENSLRVDGLYSANEVTRAALGCVDRRPYQFVQCTLNGAR